MLNVSTTALDAAFAAAQTHHRAGRLPEAEQAYRAVLAGNAAHRGALWGLVHLAIHAGRPQQAVDLLLRITALEPENPDIWIELGKASAATGNLLGACDAYRRAIAIAPAHVQAHVNYAHALLLQGRLAESLAAHERAIALAPENPAPIAALGYVHQAAGRMDDAVAAFRRAAALAPTWPTPHSNLLFALHFLPETRPDDLFAEHRRWDDLHGSPRRQERRPHENERDPARRLRVGYVSPDFRRHAVATFFEPLLAAHDPHAVEIFCYSDARRADDVTLRLQSLAHHWRSIAGIPEQAVADIIRRDRIDILVDLAGHTADNRLTVFAREPAPVQITYLGYPDTTGLSTMQFRLTDALADPPGPADALHSEKLLRLEGGFLCYQPPTGEDAPPPPDTTASAPRPITFASFNLHYKISDPAIQLWTAILDHCPTARLLIKSGGLGDASTCDRLRARFAAAGADITRLDLLDRLDSPADHLALYRQVDIALDTFPYNGTTTTCEALWMGVPVVALAGEMHHARVGISLLTAAGLPELIAPDAAGYVSRAVALAADSEGLRGYRENLRAQLSRSPLMDPSRLARAIERAYRHAWQAWCAAPPPAAP